jgi:hypothetical protein
MAKTVKKIEVKKPTVKINISLDDLYIKFYTAETIEAKIKYHNQIKNLL